MTACQKQDLSGTIGNPNLVGSTQNSDLLCDALRPEKGDFCRAFPVNISLTVAKFAGNWQIAAMHFSTLTGAAGSEAKETS